MQTLPDNLVKIPQRPATADPVWRGYGYVNSIACLNGAGAEQLDAYDFILRSDVDCFLTPSWNEFYPSAFTCGRGAYSNNDDVRSRIRALAAEYGLNHYGITNVGSTRYGATADIRRACAFSEMLTKRLLNQEFFKDEGGWPGWYRGVALLYASEIAVNHCAPDAHGSHLLDARSTDRVPIENYAHIHCWHTDANFSKHRFMNGQYTHEDTENLDLSLVPDFCMALSFQSLDDLQTAGV